MSIKYYSQAGEDALIWSIFADRKSGFFIEVGAFDGKHLSNTLSFEEQGWSGVCVEPTQQYFDLCSKNRPNSKCILAACVGPNQDEEIEFFSEPLGLLSGIRANKTQNMKGRYEIRGMEFLGFKKILVPAKTIDQVLHENNLSHRKIDFISIDTEGTELDVLKGMTQNPRLVVCEANTKSAKDTLIEYMAGRRYNFARAIGPNLFFANSMNDVSRLKSAKFDITTEVTFHPLGEKATHSRHITRRVKLD